MRSIIVWFSLGLLAEFVGCKLRSGTGSKFPRTSHSALLRSHRGISQDKLPLYLGFFQFVHNGRRRGKALLGALIAGLVA